MNLLHGGVHFADEVVLPLRQLLDPSGDIMQLSQHRFLTRREPMHPPKADAPARQTDPGEEEAFELESFHESRTVPNSSPAAYTSRGRRREARKRWSREYPAFNTSRRKIQRKSAVISWVPNEWSHFPRATDAAWPTFRLTTPRLLRATIPQRPGAVRSRARRRLPRLLRGLSPPPLARSLSFSPAKCGGAKRALPPRCKGRGELDWFRVEDKK